VKTIYVYQDYVHNNGALYRRLQETAGARTVMQCDATDILNGCLDPATVCLFIMPGGADLFYCEKLNGAGNKAIRAYVEAGGNYLGICAGAYYACTRIEWAQDATHQAIIGDRELNFFNGTAIGPITSLLEDKDIDASWNNIACLETSTGIVPAFYNAGPVFVPDKNATYETLATYKDIEGTPAALVSMKIGQGRALLTSCHIEYTPALLRAAQYTHRNASAEWTKSVCDRFEAEWTPQADLWQRFVMPLWTLEQMKVAS
jgi:glutamine amidotransferase-like uncharacterized protein